MLTSSEVMWILGRPCVVVTRRFGLTADIKLPRNILIAGGGTYMLAKMQLLSWLSVIVTATLQWLTERMPILWHYSEECHGIVLLGGTWLNRPFWQSCFSEQLFCRLLYGSALLRLSCRPDLLSNISSSFGTIKSLFLHGKFQKLRHWKETNMIQLNGVWLNEYGEHHCSNTGHWQLRTFKAFKVLFTFLQS